MPQPKLSDPAAAPLTRSLFCPDAFVSPLEIEEAVTRALAEDLGRAGDVTSIATIPENTQARAVLAAREAGTIAGLPLAQAVFRRLSPDIEVIAHAGDGMVVPAKAKLLAVSGNARAVLAAERTALNFVGHLSGIATATAALVAKARRPNAASPRRARPFPACAPCRNTPCAAAEASTTVSGSMTRS
jgi:nicotinate-nucleotide pyrophosphorylase